MELKYSKITRNKWLRIKAVTLILLPNFRKPNTGIFQENLYLHYPRKLKGNYL